MKDTTAIIPAAGLGLRLRRKIPKALVKINKRPIFIHTLANISRHPDIEDIVVVVPPKFKRFFKNNIKKFRIKKIRQIVPGGITRRESVENGLRHIDPKSKLILIHDAVRPFISRRLISEVIKQARRYQAAILGIPVKATIKKSRGLKTYIVDKTLERNNLWEIQTPQVFKKELILRAYQKFKDKNFTDDSSLLEKMGIKVTIVKGCSLNVKITTPEDLAFAQSIIDKKLKY
jgi:2-C-methyl-D-erythritol 4-phosphate cytidylyltransferase